MENKVIDYVIEDIKTLIKDGYSEHKDEFPITNKIAKRITDNNEDINSIESSLLDLLIEEYFNYIKKGM